VVKACELSLNGRLVLRRNGNNNNNNNLFVNAIYNEAFSPVWRRIKGKRRWLRASATAVWYCPGLRDHGQTVSLSTSTSSRQHLVSFIVIPTLPFV